jgi:hypothetical protein
MHDLLNQIGEPKFEKEMNEACELGNSIIQGQNFVTLGDIIDKSEKGQELQEETK